MSTRVEIVTGSLKGTIIDNAASETTLQEILAALQRMERTGAAPGGSRSGGSGPSGSPTPQSQSSGNQSGPTLFGQVAQAAGAVTSALKTTSSLLANNNSSLASWTAGLSGAMKGFPLVGPIIGTFGETLAKGIAILENWNSTLKNLSESGASFNNNILEMRAAAAMTRMDLEQFAALVKENSAGFAALGGTVTSGAKVFSKMSNEMMRPGGLGQQLLEMGMSVESINAGFAKYLSTTMKGTKVTEADTQKMTALYSDYATTLDRIAKLQGEEKNALEAKAQAIKNDAMFQVKMAGADAETRAKMDKMILQAGELYGPKGQQALKEYFLTGGTVITKESKMLASLFPEMTRGFQQGIKGAKDANMKMPEYEAELRERRATERVAAGKAIKAAEGSLSAAAAGMGGTSAEMLSAVADTAKGLTTYGVGIDKLTRDQILAREDAAVKEQKQRNTVTKSLDAFNIGIRDIASKLMTGFLNFFDRFVTGLNISADSITATFAKISANIDPALDMLESGFYILADFIEDNILPLFNTMGSIVSLAIEGWKLLLPVIDATTDVFKPIIDVVKTLWNMFIDLTHDTETLRAGLKSVGDGFTWMMLQVKIAFFEFLDNLPGIDMTKEVNAARVELAQVEKSREEFEKRLAANQERRMKEEEERKKAREARDEKRTTDKESRETQKADARAAREKAEKDVTGKPAPVPAAPAPAAPAPAPVPAAPAPAPVPATPLPGGVKGLLEQISRGEGTSDAAAKKKGLASGYDVSLGYGAYGGGPKKALSEMTMAEVKEYQKAMLADPKNKLNSSAVGKYQIISGTLKELQKELGLKDTDKFDAATQDKMGEALLKRRGLDKYTSGKISADKFQLGLSQEWASVADPRTGQGYYAGQRTAHTTDAMAKAAIAGLSNTAPQPATPKETSEEAARRQAKTNTPVATPVQQPRPQATHPAVAAPVPANTQSPMPSPEDLSRQLLAKREAEIKENRRKQEAAIAESEKSKTAASQVPTKPEVTLTDVVNQLEQLNMKIARLTAVQEDIGHNTTKAIKSNNSNIYARA